MDNDKDMQAEREAFEEADDLSHLRFEWSEIRGEYLDFSTQHAWEGWQAARAAAPVPADDYTVDDSELARKILMFMGRGSTASMEPNADPFRDRLAAKLAQWRPAATPPQQEGQQGEHPLEIYAESYDQMARMGDGRVHCTSVATDIRQNMFPITVAAPASTPAAASGEALTDEQILSVWHDAVEGRPLRQIDPHHVFKFAGAILATRPTGASVRDAALEDAAEVAYGLMHSAASSKAAADAIRALKSDAKGGT